MFHSEPTGFARGTAGTHAAARQRSQMPQVEYETTMKLPRETVWEFVKDMNNWAPFLTGYQSHEIIDDSDSIWTLKGDVGVLSRVVKLKAHVTEWEGPEKVSFTLTGVNEAVEGGGTLLMEADGEGAEPAEKPSDSSPAPSGGSTGGLLTRLLSPLFRFLMRLFNKRDAAPERQLPAAGTTSGSAGTKLRFTLRMDAGGPTAPLVNAMLGPAMLPAAEDLANKIAGHLEREHGIDAGNADAESDAAE